jgi:hypothetical protein
MTLRDHGCRNPAWKQRFGLGRTGEPIEVRDQSVEQCDELRDLLVRKPSHRLAIASEQGCDGLWQGAAISYCRAPALRHEEQAYG